MTDDLKPCPFHISGAGVVSVDSSKMFSSAKGKKQLDALKKIHEYRKKRAKALKLLAAMWQEEE